LASVTSIANEPSRTFESRAADWSSDALTGATTNAVASPVSPPELRVTDAERPEGDVTVTVVLEPLVASGWTTGVAIVQVILVSSRTRGSSNGGGSS